MPQSRCVSRLVCFLLVGVLVESGAGCRGDASNSAATAQSVFDAPFAKADGEDACDLITKTMVREATGLPDTTTLKKRPFTQNTDTPNECRYEWRGGNTKTGFGSIYTPDVYSSDSVARQFFEDRTPTLSTKEMRRRVQRATDAATKKGTVEADDAEALENLSDRFATSDSGKSVI